MQTGAARSKQDGRYTCLRKNRGVGPEARATRPRAYSGDVRDRSRHRGWQRVIA